MGTFMGPPVSIDSLTEGRCQGVLLFKVDRVYFPETVHFVVGGKRLREMLSVDLIVFDRSGKRVDVAMEDYSAIAAHRSVFLPEKCYRATNFVVRRGGKGIHRAFHIVLLASTTVEIVWELLPVHSFHLITVSEFANGCPWGLGLFDVCGTLVTMYEEGLDDIDECYGRKLILKLEDKGLPLLWGAEAVTCRLHGPCVGETLCSYAKLTEPEGVFVIVQFVRPVIALDGDLEPD